ncbi:MAG: TatD family hydrolase [Candidatus Thermoplasmatota archaeon]|nr:TatD family hydrolase [Candidatus Thermoplasmatota archaeon]
MIRMGDLPVLDSHMHLDPLGSGKGAVLAFKKQGGTHLIIVHKPYRSVEVHDIGSYERAYSITQRMVNEAREAGVMAWCVLGPYPGELPRLVDRMGLEKAVALQKQAMEMAASLVGNGVVIGLGEIGRVHYPTDEGILKSCDEILSEGMELCAEVGCFAVLHTESPKDNPSLMSHLSDMCSNAGLPKHRAVKHYSQGALLDPVLNQGLTPSILATRPNLKEAIDIGVPFLMETDFIDDPSRPDAVLPPDTVPKRMRWLINLGSMDEDMHCRMMIDLPKKVMGVDLENDR